MLPRTITCVLLMVVQTMLTTANLSARLQDASNDLEFHGYLEVSIELLLPGDKSRVPTDKLLAFDPSDVTLGTVPQIILCLTAADSVEKTALDHHDCLSANLKSKQVVQSSQNAQGMTSQLFEVLHFPLRSDNRDTHLVAITTLQFEVFNVNEVDYWADLPLMFPNDGALHRVELVSNGGVKGCRLFATLTLSCAPNQYGPRCAVTCLPPSPQLQCNPFTGDLECKGTWTGPNCDKNVFLVREEAVEFIKHRSKRANSWLRHEELFPGNIEQECEEERCSYEEAREAFENDALTQAYWRRYTDTNQCQPNPCNSTHTARCEDLVGDYSCHCLPGYHGKNCENEVNVCANQPCKNGATCLRHSPTSFSCNCPAGYRGSTCSVDIDECATANCGLHGTCVDGVNSFTCDCDPGYRGEVCDENIDDCASNPCINGGTCTDHVAFYSCNCSEQYNGVNCENRISPCVIDPCANGGICGVNPDYSFNCSCPTAYTGPLCQHGVGSPCASLPCQNGAICYVAKNNVTAILPSTYGSEQNFNCICPLGYEGRLCEREIPTCDLAKDPCPENATCISLKRQYLCACPAGYTGDACQVAKNDNDPELAKLACQHNPCQNKARCLSHENSTLCICRPGYNGTYCENEINYCSSGPCINDGICIPVPNGFFCNCAQGFNGTYCQNDINECSYRVEICQNGGTCNNTEGSFDCLCDPYHNGRFCQYDFDPCDATPCQNGGLCYHETFGYECTCINGFGGRDCLDIIDPCTDVTNPCMNQASCSIRSDDPSQANCSCTEGYFGRFCEHVWDYCVSSRGDDGSPVPRLNPLSLCGDHGYCFSKLTGYGCHCHKGYIGEKCDVEYQVPTVNCSSVNCLCPIDLVKEVERFDHNDSFLPCQFEHYSQGTCHRSTCLTNSCEGVAEKYYCDWASTCLRIYLNNEESITEDCSVIQVWLNHTKLPEETTTDEFCDKIRNMPFNSTYKRSTTIQCARVYVNDQNSSLAVSVDGIFSQRDAGLLAGDIFQRLQQELTNDSQPAPIAEDLPIMFSAIYAITFNRQLGHVQNEHDDGPRTSLGRREDADIAIYITIPLIIVFLIFCLLVFFCVTRRRRKSSLEITYVANTDENLGIIPGVEGAGTDTETPSNSESSSFSPKKVKNQENGIINPIFVNDKPVTSAAPPSPVYRAKSNTYVTIRPLDSPTFTKKSHVSPTKSVEESTIAFLVNGQGYSLADDTDGYEDMKGNTLPYDTILPPSDGDTPYAFAREFTPKTPILQKQRPKVVKSSHTRAGKRNSPTHAYVEIDLQRPPLKELDETLVVYEAAEELQSVQDSSGNGLQVEYDLARETTPLEKQKPLKKDINSSDAPDVADSGVDMSNSSSSDPSQSNAASDAGPRNENYQSPSSFFPDHDDLFFPHKSQELPGGGDVYSVPRKANPVD
ncbi:uncharacterized protein LOC143451672 isoform X1 [Clavelina lepadiformis]|uniref:uncharacterized protein LOC143451672 isoform X1 n=1 Tax=Clavelina lepadiformis TaxID=159417 RepID=UPI0040420811